MRITARLEHEKEHSKWQLVIYPGRLPTLRRLSPQATPHRTSTLTFTLAVLGTFISASTSALAIPKIRVRRGAEFWFHHAQFPNAKSPWDINPSGTVYLLRNFKPKLRRDILARLPENTGYVTYTGSDLIASYGFRPC